ncbi:hypothetical protein [Bacillus mycoides]|uniref:hypothetical protein n=1 Tax=Bacillus mycoides TaxID=1405 RepID=UPI00273A86A6|nr:hypothetical protein [Bacillus mycoides]
MHKYEIKFYLNMVINGDDQPCYTTEIEAKETAVVRKDVDGMLQKEFFEIETKHSEFVLLASKHVSEVIVKIKEEK